MSRPKLKDDDKKVKIRISLDKSVHQNLKSKGLNISGTINQLLKVAYFRDSQLLNNNQEINRKCPRREFHQTPVLMSGNASNRESLYQIWEICFEPESLPIFGLLLERAI